MFRRNGPNQPGYVFFCEPCWERAWGSQIREMMNPLVDQAAALTAQRARKADWEGREQEATDLWARLIRLDVQRGKMTPNMD